MSARRRWVALTGCAAVLATATVAGAPVAAAEDVTFYLSGTRAHPVPAAQIDLGTVSQGLSGYGVAQQIPYLASLYPAQGATPLDLSVATGVAATQAAIAAVPDGDRIVIVDVSQGGIVASLVEREQLAAGSTRKFLFVRVGDPSAPTGIMGRNSGIRLPGLTFVTAPNDSPWDRIIISHQYEGLSDWPVDQLNVLADLNALLGAVQYHNPWSYNVDLSTLPESAVTVTVNAAGATTTTYRIPATGLLPILAPFKAVGINDATLTALQKVLKPIIDSAYEPQRTSTVAAVGTKLFVAAVNGMTVRANQAGAALRRTQRYLDEAIAQWRSKSRPSPATTVAASTGGDTGATPRAGFDTAPAAGQSASAGAPGAAGVQTTGAQEQAQNASAQSSGHVATQTSRRTSTPVLSRPAKAARSGRKPSSAAPARTVAIEPDGPVEGGSAPGDDTAGKTTSAPLRAHEASAGEEASSSHDR